MQFLKKHYEKIVLSVVLLGLAAAAAALPLMVSQEREKIRETVGTVVRTKPKPWEQVNLTTNQEIVRRIEGPLKFRFSGEHNTFNPVRWVKLPGGRVMKVTREDQIGPAALVATKITPQYLTVEFEDVVTGSEKIQYRVSVHREPGGKLSGTVPLKVRQAYFTVLQVDGPPEAPTALRVQLKDETRIIRVTRDKPYKEVIGYVADLVYPPENNRSFPARKKGDKLSLPGETESYKVFDITESEVVLSSDKGKKTHIKLNPSTTP